MSPRGANKNSNRNGFHQLDASLLLRRQPGVLEVKNHFGIDNNAFVLSPVGGDEEAGVSCPVFLSDTTSTGHPAPVVTPGNEILTDGRSCSISITDNIDAESPHIDSIRKGRQDNKDSFNLSWCPKNEDYSTPFVDPETAGAHVGEELINLKPQCLVEPNVQIYRLEVPSTSCERVDKGNGESFIEYHLTKKIIRGNSPEQKNLPVTEGCHLPIKLEVTYGDITNENDTGSYKAAGIGPELIKDPVTYYSLPCGLGKGKDNWATEQCDVTQNVNRKPPQEISLSKGETMVKLGGGDVSVPPSLPHSVKVSTPSNLSLNSTSRRENRVSQVSVNNSSGTSVGPSRIPLNGAAVPSHPVVSALSKVSSVRIVPSPVSTPTPSVISGDNSSSQGPRPTVSLRNNNRPLSGTTNPPAVVVTPENPGRNVGQEAPVRPSTTSNVIDRPTAPETDDSPRRGNRERRRERRERRRERRAHRNAPPVPPPPNHINSHGGQTDLTDLPQISQQSPSHLPDLLNSHIPPPYSTLPNGSRNIGGILPPPPIHMPPPGGPIAPPFQTPPLRHRPSSWPIFGSRRSRGGMPYLAEEEAKSCCGLMVTQAVSIRWFIIMIAFVGLCCTVVGTVLGAVKTNNSEYVTITLLMIGVGIVLITVSGVAWHLTSRDAPCRVMLGLTSGGRSDTRRFMARMPPPFGRPQHPYAAMLYPEFQFRPPPPSYQASMQEYRLRLLLLDRQNGHPLPPHGSNLAIGPPNYRIGPLRPPMVGTMGHESDTSRPPSYRSRDGSVHQVSTNPSVTNGTVGSLRPVAVPTHSHSPSCLSFLSHESLYSTTSRSDRCRNDSGKVAADAKFGPIQGLEAPSTSKKIADVDDNRVTIVQSTDSSQVFGNQSVVVTVSGSSHMSSRPLSEPEMAVLAHL